MIITLCGSARFEKHFKLWNEVLTLAGHSVFSLAVYPSDKKGVKTWYNNTQKQALDAAHKNKISAPNAIVVLNRFGYVGDSTMSEIEHARNTNKKLFALESWGLGHGINEQHYKWIQDACYTTVPEYKGSPINSTSTAGFSYIFDLLNHLDRDERSALVEMVNAFKEQEEASFKEEK